MNIVYSTQELIISQKVSYVTLVCEDYQKENYQKDNQKKFSQDVFMFNAIKTVFTLIYINID